MIADDLLPQDLAAMVEAELASGERVVWLGQPIPSRIAKTSLPIVFIGIPFTAFAIFWMAAASGFTMPDFSQGMGLFPLFGIPFVLIGLGMLSSPYWMRRSALRTAYVVTDRRALVLNGDAWRGTRIRSFEPDRLSDLQRTQYPDGSGNLVFVRQCRSDGDGGRTSVEVGFLAIADVKEVENLIRELVHRAKIPNA